MLLEGPLMVIFAVGVVSSLFITSVNIIAANLYELKALHQSRYLKKHPYSKRNRYRPLVTVIIPAHNEELVIESCLKALLKSTYPKLEVIVANDASKDKTADVVRKFISLHPNRAIRIVSRRTNGGRGAVINHGIKQAKGDLIMALDADCIVERKALKRVVRHFADPKTAAVAMNIRVIPTGTIINTLQLFDYIAGFRNKKFGSLTSSEYIIGGAGATYRREVLKKVGGFNHTMKTEDIEMSLRLARVLGTKNYKLKYASDVIIFTEGVPSYKSLFKQRFRWKFGALQALYLHKKLLLSFDDRHSKLISWIRLPFALWSEAMLLLEPVFFSLFVTLAIMSHNPGLFVISCLTLTLIILMAVWSDEHLSLKERLLLSYYTPIMYAFLYVLTVIQVLAAVRCLTKPLEIIGKNKISGAYVSPERVGGLSELASRA